MIPYFILISLHISDVIDVIMMIEEIIVTMTETVIVNEIVLQEETKNVPIIEIVSHQINRIMKIIHQRAHLNHNHKSTVKTKGPSLPYKKLKH